MNLSGDVDPGRIAILTRGLSGGGVQAMMLNTARELTRRGYRVDLLSRRIPSDATAPEGVSLHKLKSTPALFGRVMAYRASPGDFDVLARPVLFSPLAPEPLRQLPALARYLREARPAALLSATTYANLVALWARAAAGSSARILVSERDDLGENLRSGVARRAWRWRYAPALIRRVYPRAEAVVAVSNGVADSLTAETGLPRDGIATVYNPVVTDDLAGRAAEPPDCAWFDEGAPPVIVNAGRLVRKKDHPTLLRAFARVRAQRPARLLILGEGRERGRLAALIEELGLADDVALAGWSANPARYMARAAAFALSSQREGFGNVLAEALACGCPVVSADCPSGPAEILDNGRFGRLTPPGDVDALAAALLETLAEPPDRERLMTRGAEFTAERAVGRYLDLLSLPARAPDPRPE